MASDYLVRATAANHQIRAFAATTQNLVEQARTIHNTSPVATAALGRLLTAGSMMGSMMKNADDLLTLQIRSEGPIGGLVVTADAQSNVKGYVNRPDVMLPPSPLGKLDVGGAIRPGILSVIMDLGLKEPYIGQVEMPSGEIAEDLTYYYAASEQVPSSVALGVLMNKNNTVKKAGGFILQLLPNADETVIAQLEERVAGISSITELLKEGHTPESLLELLLGGMDLSILDRVDTQYSCNCSKERVEKAIISIGKKDIQEMIDDKEPIEVNCHFCNSHYHFTVEELKEILVRGS